MLSTAVGLTALVSICSSTLPLVRGMVASNFSLESPFTLAGRELTEAGDGNTLHVSFSAYSLDFDAYLVKTEGVFSEGAVVHVISEEEGNVEIPPPSSRTFKSTSGDPFTLTLLEEDGSALDGLVVKDGRTFHVTASNGAEPQVVEDVDEDEGGKCGEPLLPDVAGGGVNRRLRSVGVHMHPIPRKLNLARWTDCFDGDESVHTFSIGIAVDNGLYKRLGNDEDTVATYVSSIIAEANLIYEAQVGIRLQVADVVLMKTAGTSIAWNTCGSSMNDLLGNFGDWARYSASSQGVWHLLTDCYPPPGVVGLAYVGTLCYGRGYNTGVSSYMSNFWKVVAHEIGHNFGARHSFEEGQGKTGGIMDYGDGSLNGKYQFNTQYRKAEICAEIQQNVGKCSAFQVQKTQTASPTAVSTTKPTEAEPTEAPTTATAEPSRTESPTTSSVEQRCRSKERKFWRHTKRNCKRDKKCLGRRASDGKWYCRAKPWNKTCTRKKVRGRWRKKCQYAPPQ